MKPDHETKLHKKYGVEFSIESPKVIGYSGHTYVNISAKTKKACQAGIVFYMTEFHPAGYGTEISLSPEEVSPNHWEATLRRSVSCE